VVGLRRVVGLGGVVGSIGRGVGLVPVLWSWGVAIPRGCSVGWWGGAIAIHWGGVVGHMRSVWSWGGGVVWGGAGTIVGWGAGVVGRCYVFWLSGRMVGLRAFLLW